MLPSPMVRRIILNSILGIILILVWSKFVNLSQISQILSRVDWRLIIPITFFVLASGTLRGCRLKLLLKRYPLSLKDAVMVTYLSQFLSFLIPVRAGELTKSVYLSSQFDLNLGQSLVWVFIDRFLDFWMVLILIVVFVLAIPSLISQQTVIYIALLFLLFTALFLLAIYQNQLIRKLIGSLLKLLGSARIRQWLEKLIDNVLGGLELLKRKPRDLIFIMSLTLLATISDTAVWWFTFRAVGQSLEIGLAVVGNGLTALTFLIPSAPGYVGTAEAATLAVYSAILGLPIAIVSAASVLFHGITIVAILTVGLTSLYLLKFDLKTVWSKLKGR